MRIHDRIDLAFVAWGRLVSRWPVWTLLAVEHWYDSLPACPDLEVRELLDRARENPPGREVPVVGPTGEWI